MNKQNTNRRERSPGDRLLAGVFLFLLPWVLLGLVELALRMFEVGPDLRLFKPSAYQPDYLAVNQEVGRRYFSGDEYGAFGTQDQFRREKRPSTLRVFALGGSSTAGYPYQFSGTFPAMLEDRLAQAYPDYHVEVINLGMTAISSYTVVDFMGELLDVSPDLLVVYMGHNEFYGALGSASTQRVGSSRLWTRTYLALGRLRLFQAFRRAISGAVRVLSSSDGSGGQTLMATMAADRAIPLDGALYQKTEANFAANLATIISRAKAAGVPVVVGTLVSNLSDQPPFISLTSNAAGEEQLDSLLAAGQSQLTTGNLDAAVATFEAAVAHDSAYARAWFLLGRAMLANGDMKGALDAYTQARNWDGLRFRAASSFNMMIRLVCAREGADVAEVESALAEVSPGGIIGGRLLLEHLHPNLEGYFLIGKAFAGTIRDERLLVGGTEPASPAGDEWFRRRMAVTPLDTVVAGYRIAILTSGWPFRVGGRLLSARDLKPGNEIERLARDILLDSTDYERAHVELATQFEREGRIDQAIAEYSVLARTFPYNHSPFQHLGRLLVEKRAFHDALPHLRRAAALTSDAFSAKWAGTILLQQGESEAAIPYLESALNLNPGDDQALYNLSGAYFQTGRVDLALKEITVLLKHNPGYPNARQFHEDLRRYVEENPDREVME